MLRRPAFRLAALRFLRLAIPRLHRPFAPCRLRCQSRRPGAFRLCRHHRVTLVAVEKTGPPKFLQDPHDLFAHALRLRQNRTRLAITSRRHGPRSGNDEGFCDKSTFEAQSHGFQARCLRFVTPVTRTPRKTRFQVLAKLSWVGSFHRVSMKGFCYSLISVPLSQASLGATPVSTPQKPYTRNSAAATLSCQALNFLAFSSASSAWA
jgi:hypothetical protein